MDGGVMKKIVNGICVVLAFVCVALGALGAYSASLPVFVGR